MKRKMAPCTAPNCTDEPDAKKIKVEDDSKEKEAIKKQMKKIFYYRDLLERNLKKGKVNTIQVGSKNNFRLAGWNLGSSCI